jgi:hypothetical protein
MKKSKAIYDKRRRRKVYRKMPLKEGKSPGNHML